MLLGGITNHLVTGSFKVGVVPNNSAMERYDGTSRL